MDQNLAGKVIAVTGASSGLGAQLARSLVAAGAHVVLAARRADRLDTLRAELGSRTEVGSRAELGSRTEVGSRAEVGSLVDAVACDVAVQADRERLIGAVIQRHGRIDGLVNNAGIGAAGPALKTSPDAFARVLDVNLTAPFALSCLAATHMRSAGGGAIVNIASVMGMRSVGQIFDAAYVASKAGVIGLTRELASQWGRYGIRVNAVAPGFFASEMTAELGADAEAFPAWLTDQIPLARGGRPGELDQAILYLLGPGASFVTGHVLTVDGGMATR